MPRRGHSEIVWQPCHEADYARPDQSQVLTFPSLQPQKTFATMCPSLLPDPGFCCGEIFDEKMQRLIVKKLNELAVWARKQLDITLDQSAGSTGSLLTGIELNSVLQPTGKNRCARRRLSLLSADALEPQRCEDRIEVTLGQAKRQRDDADRHLRQPRLRSEALANGRHATRLDGRRRVQTRRAGFDLSQVHLRRLRGAPRPPRGRARARRRSRRPGRVPRA